MKGQTYFRVPRLALACLVFWGVSALAQIPVSNLVLTVGTTVQDANSNNWSYVLVGAPQTQLLAGKQFAVYGKAGTPTSPGNYTLHGTMGQQTSVAAINSLLQQSVALGEDLPELTNALDTLLHYYPGISNASPVQKVLAGFQAAATNADTAQMISLLAHLHPGLVLCGGQGFAEIITTTTTYEVREANPAPGMQPEVIGRVTITPGSPTILPAPGAPFQVVTNDASDNLRIRLRWGTSDDYRRVSLLGYGFNVWRIPLAAAIANGYTNHPPTIAQLHTDTNFTQANSAPVMATKDFSTNSGTGGANDSADGTTYFFSDNNGRPLGPTPNYALATNGPLPIPPDYLKPFFVDGAQFYYFITALDVLGHDGYVSPGSLGQACRRIPPPAPSAVNVQNTYQVLSAGNLQCLTVAWQQDLSTNDQVAEYWVYRWPNTSMVWTNDTVPTENRIGVVSLIPNGPTNFFQDTNADAPTTPGSTNYWYTVRAVSQSACGPLLSPHSMPAWGVLRERNGPAAASGQIIGSCGSTVTLFDGLINITNTTAPPDTNNWNFILACQRADPGMAWAQFFVTNQAGAVQTLGPIYFPPNGNTVTVTYFPSIDTANPVTGISCVAGSQYGMVSAPASVPIMTSPGRSTQVEALFTAGQVMLTSLTSTNALLSAIGGASPCYASTSASAYPDGTVRLQFNYNGGSPLLIKAAGASGWEDVAVATLDPNGFYSVFYPACLLGALPHFEGCVINLPTEGECSHHITGGANNGPINPLQITFNLTQGSAEFRLYRSINNGPLTMIAQGPAPYNESDPYATIVRNDDAMPPSGASLCYYVQLLDANGNGGPMSFLGCKDVKPTAMPRPSVAEPEPAGAAANPQLTINWYCPTSGVYRFQVFVQRADHPAGSAPLAFTSAILTPLTSYNTNTTYLGLQENPAKVSQFDAALLTPPVGPNFGPGSQFTLTVDVLTNVPYHIAIASMDDQGNAGQPSKEWKATWKPSNFTAVPWPARPLPSVRSFDDVPSPASAIQPRVAAVLLANANSQLDLNYPVGIRIGDLTPLVTQFGPPVENIGTTNFFTYQVPGPSEVRLNPLSPQIDPNTMIFRRLSANSERSLASLLPIVVYRQQVTNATFPIVSGTLIQVSPLIEKLAYGTTLLTNGNYNVTLYDRLIAGGSEVAAQGNGNFLYLRDQQAVMLGASYQYFVVRMSEAREIAEIIPAGTVTIPLIP